MCIRVGRGGGGGWPAEVTEETRSEPMSALAAMAAAVAETTVVEAPAGRTYSDLTSPELVEEPCCWVW